MSLTEAGLDYKRKNEVGVRSRLTFFQNFLHRLMRAKRKPLPGKRFTVAIKLHQVRNYRVMWIFKDCEKRSRKAQEAYSDFMLKAAGSMYTACFLLFFTVPANVLVNGYMKNPELGICGVLENTLDVALVAIFLFAVPAALAGKAMEYYALNIIDKLALVDYKKKRDECQSHDCDS